MIIDHIFTQFGESNPSIFPLRPLRYALPIASILFFLSTGLLAYGRQEDSTAAWHIFRSDESGSWNLYRSVPGGEAFRNLTPDDGDVSFQGVSEDGQWVVYHKQGGSDLYRAQLNGSARDQLTYLMDDPPADIRQSANLEGVPLFVGTADGWYIGQFRTRIFGIKEDQFKWLTPPNADVEGIDIAPDGKFVVYQDYTQNIVQLYRMNPDGTDAIGIAPTTERFQFAAWAEDGLYAYATSDAGRRLYHVNLDGSEPELLLDVGVWDRWFGVRGGWIYFAKENHLRRQNIESGEEQTIATIEEGELYTITAARDWLYYTTFNQTLHESSLFRVRPDGSELSEVLHTQSTIDNLLTSPDREYTIFLGSTESYAFRGSDRWKLAVDSSYNFAGWTPDGTEMIFNPTQVACPCNVMTMKPDGSDKKYITDVSTQAYFITKAPIEDEPWMPLLHLLLGAVILVGAVIWWRLALKRG
ncbi:MAG: DUF5050 domain-containing protein [Chloroflexi bacterium]|nr:DUF5050 domain-containing protein [Chloroflexota bacterium]